MLRKRSIFNIRHLIHDSCFLIHDSRHPPINDTTSNINK